jgi:hypothetical protein
LKKGYNLLLKQPLLHHGSIVKTKKQKEGKVVFILDFKLTLIINYKIVKNGAPDCKD